MSPLSVEFRRSAEVSLLQGQQLGERNGYPYFHRFLDQLGQLSKRQREKVVMRLEQATKAEVAAGIIEKASVEHLECPRCRGHDFYLHGRAHGLQRYKCKGCRRTFNGLTGTPLAHLRAKAKWLDFLDCMSDPATTVRKAARWVGVHKNTTFRWRHRFLTIPKTDRPPRLHGIAEADEIYFLESEKGARHLSRAPRRRGGSATKRGISDEQICVLVARDRTGQTFDFVTGNGPVTKSQLFRCLPPILDADVLLVSDSNASYRYFAREAGITHESVKPSDRRQGEGRDPCAKRECLPQPIPGMASPFPRCGDALPSELPGLALGDRPGTHRFP